MNKKKYLIYSAPTLNEGPALYFFDLEHNMTICRIGGAEIFIDCFEDQETGKTILTYIEENSVIQRQANFDSISENARNTMADGVEIFDLASSPDSLM